MCLCACLLPFLFPLPSLPHTHTLPPTYTILPFDDGDTAMMPSLGQGGCQAIEDAYVLTNILKNTRRRSELPAALQSYYKQRIIRTTAVQYLSRASSDLLRFFYSTPASIQFHPFRIEVPNGLDSIVTSICKPIFPALLYFQFRFVISSGVMWQLFNP